MCGICGFTGNEDSPTLMRMTDAIVHRGPNEAGLWGEDGISLGMRRLSIVDLETGKQPVFNEDNTICVVFNGEIYNHPELRAELQKAGHHFKTDHSDTEVLVHLYEEYGDDFLNKLNGMFTIALWDENCKRLLLARDRAGIKPLYFSRTDTRLIFASEIKSILTHPSIRRVPNFHALYHYFSFRNIPAPLSAFEGIEQLLPGEKVVFENGHFSRAIWWQIRFSENFAITEQEAASHIAELLEDSVRLCMRSDVPFGAYLSGGLDSSSIAALMSRNTGDQIKTFSLVYENEIKHKAADQIYARMMAKYLGTDHYEHVLTCDEVVNSIDAILNAFDEPFSGVTSTYFITKLISKHVKVALSGDGADELFGSYLSHRLAQPLFHYEKFQSQRLDDLTSDDRNHLEPYSDKLDYLAGVFKHGDEAARRCSLYLWDEHSKRAIFSQKMLDCVGSSNTEEMVRQVYANSNTTDPLNRALYCDFEMLLPDQVLTFVDRLSMAHSVEVRPPFLDYRLIEFAATLPGSFKIKHGRVKHILKEAVRGLIPDEIINRPKEGFIMPLDLWLLTNLRTFVEATLSPERLAIHGLLRTEAVKNILDSHYSGKAHHGPRIWNLIMFQRWWEKHFV